MNKDRKHYEIAVLQLMHFALDETNRRQITKEDFMDATFKERVEMLKLRFEQALIECKKDLIIQLENKSILTQEQEQRLQIQIAISEAIEAARNKKYKKVAENPVLFTCFLHNDNNPSMSWSAQQHGFYCFSCSKNNKVYDLFDFLTHWNKEENSFKKAFKLAVFIMVKDSDSIENIFLEKNNGEEHTTFIPYTKEMNKIRHWSILFPIEEDEVAYKKLKEERAISLTTAKRMSVMTWYPTTNNIPWGLCYWVFINDDGSYTRRFATKNDNQYSKRFGEPMKWWNPKDKPIGIFNSRVIEHCRQFQEVCFVTESAIDAMSCEELRFHAIGLNSINNLSKFFRDFIDNQASIKLICLTDNDEAGLSAVEDFNKRGLYVAEHLQQQDNSSISWLRKFKDINEALISDRRLTLEALKDIENKANEYYRGLRIDKSI